MKLSPVGCVDVVDDSMDCVLNNVDKAAIV